MGASAVQHLLSHLNVIDQSLGELAAQTRLLIYIAEETPPSDSARLRPGITTTLYEMLDKTAAADRALGTLEAIALTTPSSPPTPPATPAGRAMRLCDFLKSHARKVARLFSLCST